MSKNQLPTAIDTDQATSADGAPPLQRQDELRAASLSNIAVARAPYDGVRLATREELQWVIRQHAWSVVYPSPPQARANLRGVNLQEVDLHGELLNCVDLRDACLDRANLSACQLRGANLSGCSMTETTFRGTDLRNVRMDYLTDLTGAEFDSDILVANAVWNNVQLTTSFWPSSNELGDARLARQARRSDGTRKDRRTRVTDYDEALHAYRQLAASQQAQGLYGLASVFMRRAQELQLERYRFQRRWDLWLIWLLFGVLSGYGYSLRRIVFSYLLILLIFAATYFVVGLPHSQPVSLPQNALDAFLVSLSAIHGRVFFEQLGAYSIQAWIAAIESVAGIVIEAIFVAMLIQRFFNR